MELIRAIIRPEKADTVVAALDQAGFPSLTKVDVFGRGKQKGIQVGDVHYDELHKVMLLIAVDSGERGRAVEVITEHARTGNFGDGKVFVSPIEEAYTIRTGEMGL